MSGHVCPFWVGYLLAHPLRKIFQNPSKILDPYVRPNMMVLDVGCAMGFFSLPLAGMVQPDGRVFCADIQEKMLKTLQKRARKAGVSEFIEIHVSDESSLRLKGLDGRIDFALAFAVLHESTHPSTFLKEIHQALKPKAKLLLAEPKGRVTEAEFEHSVAVAGENHFILLEKPRIQRSHSALFEKSD